MLRQEHGAAIWHLIVYKLTDYQAAERLWLQAAQKDPEATRAKEMEYWSNGVLGSNPSLHHSSTPVPMRVFFSSLQRKERASEKTQDYLDTR
jgi:hypothetical protein